MRRLILRTVLPFVSLIVLSVGATAQVIPFDSRGGLEMSRQKANDTLEVNDVVLIAIASGPDLPVPPLSLPGFDIETGKSGYWGYNYYSPSADKAAGFIVSNVFGVQMALGGIDDTTEGMSEALAIPTTGAYFNSVEMAAQVRANSDYQAFRTAYGTIRTAFALLMLGLPPDMPGLPGGFPTDVPIWTVAFTDDVDTTKGMACFVASTTGQTLCVTEGTVGIDDEASATGRLTLQVVPNPASGRTRVTLVAGEPREGMEQVRVGLFDATGAQVLDLSESFARSGYRYAEFDASSIAAGSYFVRAVGGGFNGVVGTVTLGR